MAERTDSSAPGKTRAPGPELRLVDRRAFVGFPELPLAPGVVITEFALQIPDITFPLNISGGASKYQKKKLDFGVLELSIDAEVLQREVRAVAQKLPELDDLRLHFRPGYLEVQARLKGERTPITFKVAFDGDGERLAVYFYDVRLYAYSATPASRLGALISEAIRLQGLLPEVERRGANGFSARILPSLVDTAAVGRGYKMPALDQARLAEATVSSRGLKLRFSAGGLPPAGIPDEELLLALEGARAFADAEELLAEGKLAQAREAYLRLGDATEAHPFAVERLLTLLVCDVAAHDLVLDLAASLIRRREKSATALWTEAVVREHRGESARASERYLALCNLARKQQEEAGAFFAAEAAARASRDHAPQLAVKALHELLGLRPDHLPSLKALARASDQAKDRAGAIRAYRRLAALAREAGEAAEAHVQLARLCAQTEDDVAGARLHCEAALRLSPDHPDALLQLGELCYRSGEWLRAIKALDRLREVALGRHEVDRVGRANLLAGQVWETGLKQPENALLRYREAASLLPAEPRPLALAARVAESLGKIQEAVSGFQQAIELAGPAPKDDEAREAAHAAHHALARLLKTRLGEPGRAREHLEAALCLDPRDSLALEELLPYFRASGKAVELADACEKAAAIFDEPQRRAALWAEAGELYRGRLNQPDKALRLLSQALEADGTNRMALEGMLALAESRRDGAQLTRCLKALAELSTDAKERVRHFRRLAVAARDLSFDLDLAVYAYREILRLEPDDLPALGELSALERRRSDMPGLAWALEQRARVAESLGDKRLAAAALREMSQVLDTRLGRSSEALVAQEKSTRLFPEPNALLELATLSLRLERPANARRALEDVLALLPKHAPPGRWAEVRARLGQACELLGDKESARENYALAFPLRRLDDELADHLEALYQEANLTRELSELWAARAQALTQAGRMHDAAPLFFKAAQHLLEAGDSSGAMVRLKSALDASSDGPLATQVLEAMAALEEERHEPLEAARLLARRAALAKAGHDAAHWYFRAATLSKGTEREPPLLAQALEQDGAFLAARLRRAELEETASPREALVDFEAVLGADRKDFDALGLEVDRADLTRRAALAATRCGQLDAARRWLVAYTSLRPDDVGALGELASLHRRSGSLDALVELLGELWPRLDGAERAAARREYAEGALSLGRTAEATHALRLILADAPQDVWAAEKLLGLLPLNEGASAERLDLLSRLIAASTGQARADLLARRAEIHRAVNDLSAARADILEASAHSPQPAGLLRELAELSRQAHDELAELAAWRQLLQCAGVRQPWMREALERLLVLARNRATTGDFTRAMEAWEALLSLPLEEAERFEALCGLASTAKAMGNSRRAEEALGQASRQGPPAQRVKALLERAELLEQRGALDETVEALGDVLALVPHHEQATQGLQRALRAQGDWEGLAEVLLAEAARSPKEAAVALQAELASIFLDLLHLPGPGETALRKWVQLEPSNSAARQRLAGLLAARHEVTEALGQLEEAAAHLEPAQAAAVLRSAASLAKDSDDTLAEMKFLRAAQRLSKAAGSDLATLCDALYLHGAIREALPLQRELAEATSFEETPELGEQAWLRLADLADQAGDEAQAEAALRRVVQERPLQARAVERLAQLLGRRDPQGAIELKARFEESLAASPRTAGRLLELAREARRHDKLIDLSLALYARAAECSDAPLPIREEAVAMLRASARTAELVVELEKLAALYLEQSHFDAAIGAWDEVARLAQGAGRIDDALRTLERLAARCEEEGRVAQAADFQVRRAELLQDTKLDLEAAEQALEAAWNLRPAPSIAPLGLALSRRRSDRDSELDWLERSLTFAQSPLESAQIFLELAKAHLGLQSNQPAALVFDAPLLAPDQAEAALRKALSVDPTMAEAEAMLLSLLEREGRAVDMAAHHEEMAAHLRPGPERAQRLLTAAELYRTRADRPHDAAAALLAARAANPDDESLTQKVADLLQELGRLQEAADFDALLLEANPFHQSFERYSAFLTQSHENLLLAGLLSRRAEALSHQAAAAEWLLAAQAFMRAGAVERAALCETAALDAAPDSKEAFEALMRGTDERDVRRRAELLAMRAQAVPAEASTLLRQRAELLTHSGDALLAARAWDDFLALAPDDVSALAVRGDLAAQGGGPRAAQPFDRRVVQLGGQALPPATRLKLWQRLGLAAMEANAFRDAVDAFEAVFELHPGGETGREALFTLSEAYGRLNDVEGQVHTTLRLAERGSDEEADALYRRALALAEGAPETAVVALDWLLKRHPGDAALYDLGQVAYARLGRLGDCVELHERYAEAAGGKEGSRALLEAARLLESELQAGQRAFELRLEALKLNPQDLDAGEGVLAEARRRNDVVVLEQQLRQAIEVVADENRWADHVLELATLLEGSGRRAEASGLLRAMFLRGPSQAGYTEALLRLERIARAEGDDGALGPLQQASAQLLAGAERAHRLLEAAHSFGRAGRKREAVNLAQESLALAPTREAAQALVQFTREQGANEDVARALMELARIEDSPTAKAAVWLEAVQAWRSAGHLAEARAVLERALEVAPKYLSWEEAAQQFLDVEAPLRALAVGFEPAIQARQFERALMLADAAADAPKALQALWALAQSEPQGPHGARLIKQLRTARDEEGLARLAGCVSERAPTLALEIEQELLLEFARAESANVLAARGALDPALDRAIEGASPGVLTTLLPHSDTLRSDQKVRLLEAVVAAVPERRAQALRSLATLHSESGQLREAVSALAQLAQEEDDASARAALHVERGELLIRLGESALARAAFERALVDDPTQSAAVLALAHSYREGPADRFVAMVDRLRELAGDEAALPFQEPLVEALEGLGRLRDAKDILSAMPETGERIARRASLAQQLGLKGEALSLRERVEQSPEAMNEILAGYLTADLVPFAVRLGQRLFEEGALHRATRQLLAERLAPTAQGAGLAARVWPAILEESWADADGWTLYAEALRHLGQDEAASVADGFGAALSASKGVAPMARFAPLRELAGTSVPVPEGVLAVTDETMPRLASATREVLEAFGATGVKLALDPNGGVEAFLAGKTLVLGAGALAAFGQAELACLMAMALSLGEAGVTMRWPGEVEGFEEAAAKAFEAFPASWATGRVLAHLDARVRGGDLRRVDEARLLKDSAAFRAVAIRALEQLRA